MAVIFADRRSLSDLTRLLLVSDFVANCKGVRRFLEILRS